MLEIHVLKITVKYQRFSNTANIHEIPPTTPPPQIFFLMGFQWIKIESLTMEQIKYVLNNLNVGSLH